MHKSNLLLFLVVSAIAGGAMPVGWLVGLAFGEPAFIGAFAAASFAILAAGAVTDRLDVLEGAEWSAIARFGFVGFLLGMLVISLSGIENEVLILIGGVAGSGLGAVFGKFLDLHFLPTNPPQ